MCNHTKRVGKCSQCGNPADCNSPAIDDAGNLWCNDCAIKDNTGQILWGVKQVTDENGEYISDNKYFSNGIILWDLNDGFRAWAEGGHIAIPILDVEEGLDPIFLLAVLKTLYVERKKIRCTGCGTIINRADIAGRPLFAGAHCKDCWEQHQKETEEQRKRGYVCGMCGQPYNLCCC